MAHVSYVPYNIHPIVHITPPLHMYHCRLKALALVLFCSYPVPPTLNKILLTYLLTYLHDYRLLRIEQRPHT